MGAHRGYVGTAVAAALPRTRDSRTVHSPTMVTACARLPSPCALGALLALAVAVPLGSGAPARTGTLLQEPSGPPLTAKQRWPLDLIRLPAAWDMTTGGSPGPLIAVVDTGVEVTSDLTGRVESVSVVGGEPRTTSTAMARRWRASSRPPAQTGRASRASAGAVASSRCRCRSPRRQAAADQRRRRRRRQAVASTGVFSGNLTAIQIRWQRCSRTAAACKTVSRGSAYLVVRADRGKRLRVLARATGEDGIPVDAFSRFLPVRG